MRPALALVVLLALAGCSDPPTTLANPRDSIMLQWQRGKTSESMVKTEADRHCDAWGKHAVAGDRKTQGDTIVQSFRCE